MSTNEGGGGSGDVSSTRLYLGNLPKTATKEDVRNHFASHSSTVKIHEVKLMNGFGFIEFEDELDAREIVPAFHGTQFMGERLIVQFAKGARREPHHERPPPRPRRTPFRMTISGLPVETSWQDLKDFARQSGLDVVYSEVSRERDGRGYVEYETLNDLQTAVEKLDNREFKNLVVHCIADPQDERTFYRDRRRSRSPGPYRGRNGGYPQGPQEDYDGYGRPPRRGYSPRRDDYRRRSPPPREYYERGYPRSPRGGPRGPPFDDYPPPSRPRYYEDPYEARGPPPPPRRGPYEDPYPAPHGHGRPPYGGGPPSPRRRSPGRPQYGGGPPSPRRRSPGAQQYEQGYERSRYWYGLLFSLL